LTSKPETILLQIKELDNQNHSESFLKFYNWLIDDEDSSVRNATNYLMILRLFSKDISHKGLTDVTKEDVITFLDKRKKSIDDGSSSHRTELSSSGPVDVVITFQGYGTGNSKTGPIGKKVTFTEVIPEFGTIAMMILAVSILSLIAVTAKSRVVQRF